MQEKNFTAYEYATKTVKATEQSMAMDMYESFGWEITSVTPTFTGSVTLSLKRDRKQKHKQELNKLERQAEDTFAAIASLQKAKVFTARIFAYIFGIVATLVLGGGMCLTMLTENDVPAFVGGIILGVVGLVMCGVNYFIYSKIVERKTAKILPVIDQTEEKFANVLEKGNDLLQADLI